MDDAKGSDRMTIVHIVKRKGHKEEFSETKLYRSILSACLSAHVDHEESEHIARLVTREIKKWIEDKEEVTSEDIFRQASEELKHLSKEASFMYTTHRDIS